RLGQEMRERVTRAPNLFSRVAVVVDFGGLSRAPDAASARTLLEALREAGVLPVALAYGTRDIEALSMELGLPLLAKFRAQYESGNQPAVPAATAAAPEPVHMPEPVVVVPATPATSLMHPSPVRSGQQIYAQGRDLVVSASVGAGAEVIADG